MRTKTDKRLIKLTDAANLIGTHEFDDDWSNDDLVVDKLSEMTEAQEEALFRVREVGEILLKIITTKKVKAYSEDHRANINELKMNIVSDVHFEININDNSYSINGGANFCDPTSIYVDQFDLLSVLEDFIDTRPKPIITYDWKEIILMAFEFAITSDKKLRQSDVIKYIKAWHSEEYDCEPGYKELNPLAKEVLRICALKKSGKH